MTKIKLCGIRREQDAEYANAVMPDMIGFVFVQGRKRFVSYEKALEIRKRLSSGIIPVGVFINEDISNIAALVKNGVIDMVQLHGSENDDYIRNLKEKISVPVIRAFQVKSSDDIDDAKNSKADMVLLDSGTGTGKTFSHSLIKNIERPYFLAGGLDSENVGEAVKALSPYGVDASSSLETDGFKDIEKMIRFTAAVRSAAADVLR